ncbi:Manganese ABC transporter, inner membrane permease protein SitC [Candidatus Liberibacter americanus str. Sao Paulo]|uniref:Manganese ABC transporter, inner membrane permease protein SitC n=2 Tax=Candidatus Liberibacter americanus TaxID=309868 RepID=U6B8Q9_9HYPH|nr:Manganese ABC transporter, inner membrane permease protein SitC [Candidatus Liberibacter americanus str. Sao Paulo]
MIIEPFTYNYMSTAIWVGSLIGCICGILSAYVILKGWSSLCNGMSHAILLGIVSCYKFKLPLSIGASFSGLLAASIMVIINEKTKLKEDVSIAVVYMTFYSIAMFILSLSPNSIYIDNIFLGGLLSISNIDIIQVMIISFFVLSIIWMKWRDFLYLFFDEEHARSTKINVKFLKILFFTVLITSIVVSFQTVGILLVTATIITPGATAIMISKTFGKYLILSAFIGFITCFIGTYISYFIDCSPSGVVVITQISIFLISIFSFPKQRKAF